jgi:large subunit ribosomal protein L23
MRLKPIATEKAVMMIESANTLTFSTDLKQNKDEIKKEVEDMFSIKVDKIRTIVKNNQKYAYVKLNKKNPAIDIASKLGLI